MVQQAHPAQWRGLPAGEWVFFSRTDQANHFLMVSVAVGVWYCNHIQLSGEVSLQVSGFPSLEQSRQIAVGVWYCNHIQLSGEVSLQVSG